MYLTTSLVCAAQFHFVAPGAGGGGGGFHLHGNPGDYAWGRGGLDAIITQVQARDTAHSMLLSLRVGERDIAHATLHIIHETAHLTRHCTLNTILHT